MGNPSYRDLTVKKLFGLEPIGEFRIPKALQQTNAPPISIVPFDTPKAPIIKTLPTLPAPFQQGEFKTISNAQTPIETLKVKPDEASSWTPVIIGLVLIAGVSIFIHATRD
jgi:hypothetical protein